MMPGPHVPPAVPVHPSRRQSDFSPYMPPQQTHSPVHHPYAHFPPPYHGHPHAPPQWYYPPQHHYPPPPAHYAPAQHPPPRHYMQHAQQYQPPHFPQQGPVIVSSNLHAQAAPYVNRPPEKSPALHAPHAFERTFTPQQNMSQEVLPVTPSPVTAAVPPHQPQPGGAFSERPPSRPPPNAQTPEAPVQSAPSPAAVTAVPTPRSNRRVPWYPSLPWYSDPDQPFPARHSRMRRRRDAQRSSVPLELPLLPSRYTDTSADEVATVVEAPREPETKVGEEEQSESQSAVAAASEQETPITSEAPSEADSTHPTTPSSTAPNQLAPSTPRQSSHTRTATKTAVPIISLRPAVPAIPQRKASAPSAPSVVDKDNSTANVLPTDENNAEVTKQSSENASAEASSPTPKMQPKSWAELLRQNKPTAAPAVQAPGIPITNGSAISPAATLGDVIRAFNVESDSKITFIEPRGLVNTGNMCYMNSILQVLVFCVPFYNFLDQVARRSAQSFSTPLLDAMILFMREYKVIDSAASVDQLRMRLKDNELEQYGDSLIPEYVYDVIKKLPRFSTMRRGHQQDAEEFLGFLLEGLHDECAQILSTLPDIPSDASEITSPVSEKSSLAGDGWMEVGPKQKAAITRSSGHTVSGSPITKIFGGHLRSELRVPGLKNSVTLEPYQPLQLDIGAPTVNNIVDALKNLTRPEILQGDFNSPRGPGTSATKQVFIDTLPPVLILHLKRFQYDNTGGTQKIWKKVGYPLELEIPKEVFPQSKRNQFALRGGLPHYRLISVVYHHGKSAAGGHYTVDVRRQEGREWIRLDDTVIRRVRSEDVAESGTEDDPQLIKAALESHKRDTAGSNIYDQFGEEVEEKEDGEGWSQVNGSAQPNASAPKKWSGIVNGNSTTGTATPTSNAGKRTPRAKDIKDNKVAYILMYQAVEA